MNSIIFLLFRLVVRVPADYRGFSGGFVRLTLALEWS